MICPTCKPWYATTWPQWERRQRMRAQHPDVRTHPCPDCKSEDWITRPPPLSAIEDVPWREAWKIALAVMGAAAAFIVIMLAVSLAFADERITRDEGGILAAYVGHYERLREKGERVIIDGPCFSACTLVMSLPESQVCATDRARLYFHAAYQEYSWFGFWRRRVINQEQTDYMMSLYRRPVRAWIVANGGLGKDHIVMDAAQVQKYVHRCA